jgi:hypothetical protein
MPSCPNEGTSGVKGGTCGKLEASGIGVMMVFGNCGPTEKPGRPFEETSGGSAVNGDAVN